MSRYAEATRTVPDRFAITVPESWFALDLRAGLATGSIDPLVNARIARTQASPGGRAAVAAVLRDAARQATACGAVYCGVMVEIIDGAGLSATVSVSAWPGAADQPTATAGDLVLALRRQPACSTPGTWRKIQIVELPAVGLAARASGVERVETAALAPDLACSTPTIVTTMRTLVPVPGTRRVAQIDCRSPNIAVANALHDLFDAVTATFRFVRGGPEFCPPV